MEKQVLLAIVISLYALFAFQYYLGYRTAHTPKTRQPAPIAMAPKPVLVPLTETWATGQKLSIDGSLYHATLDSFCRETPDFGEIDASVGA